MNVPLPQLRKKAFKQMLLRLFTALIVLGISVSYLPALSVFADTYGDPTARTLALNEYWWDEDWDYEKRVSLLNTSDTDIGAYTTVSTVIDTATLVDDGKLQDDCDDLRITYGATTQTELVRYIDLAAGATDCSDSTATTVYFQTQATIESQEEDPSYYYYYGNASAIAPSDTLSAFDINTGAEVKSALLAVPLNGDDTGINSDGVESPTTATGAIRYAGQKSALSFDGMDDMVIGDAYLGSDIDQLTLEFWIYPKNDEQAIYKDGLLNDGSNSEIEVGIASGNLGMRIANGVYDWNMGALSSGSWHHVAITYENPTWITYIDGTYTDTLTQAVTDFDIDPGYCIGCKSHAFGLSNPSTRLNGILDELRVSDVVRYHTDFIPQIGPFVGDSHTKLLLHFDENGDDSRNVGYSLDDSGNNAHGAIASATYVAGLIGVDSSEPDTGYQPTQPFAGHSGVFLEEGTTNKITNPSFEHTTFDTNWSSNVSGDWWEAGGATDVLAAYQPLGASDLADSYINLANPGTNDAFPTVAPTWAAETGWTFDGTQCLGTGINAHFSDQNLSLVVSIASGSTAGQNNPITMTNIGYTNGFGVSNSLGNGRHYFNGGHVLVSPPVSTGVLAVAGNQGYFNGAPDGGTISNDSQTNAQLYVGCASTAGSPFINPGYTYFGDVRAYAIYDSPLTAVQTAAVSNAMSALNVFVSENTTAPFYKFGSKSAQITADATGNFTSSINVGNINDHTLSTYVYDGTYGNIGGIVDASIASIVFNSMPQNTTYTDMGGGWWRLSFTGAGIASPQDFGVQVQSGKTVFMDGVQLEQKLYPTTLTDGSFGDSYSWTGTANESTSTRTGTNIKYDRAGNLDFSEGTISFWYKPNVSDGLSMPNASERIFDVSASWYGDTDGGGFVIDRSPTGNGGIALSSSPFGGTGDIGFNPSTLQSDTWYHIVATWGNNIGSLFLNNPADPATGNFVPLAPTTSTTIGPASTSYFGGGLFSDIRIYDIAISASEVSDLYNASLVSTSHSMEYSDAHHPTYLSPFVYESDTIDASDPATWETLSWDQNIPEDAGEDAVKLQFAVKSVDSGWVDSDFLGSDCTPSSHWEGDTGSVSVDLSACPQFSAVRNVYARYRLYLDTNDQAVKPELSNLGIDYTTSDTPPSKSDISPVSGSTIYEVTPTITFTTDTPATCRISPLDESYDDMSDDVSCDGGGTTSQSCTAADLGVHGANHLYVACTDAVGNMDTAETNEEIVYIFAVSAFPIATLDPDMPSTDNNVVDIVDDGTYAYVAGSFEYIGSGDDYYEKPYIAKIVDATGEVDETFTYTDYLNHDYDWIEFNSLALSESGLYVGGNYGMDEEDSIGFLVKLDLITGAVIETFNPGPDGYVEDLLVAGDALYVSGYFNYIGGLEGVVVARLDLDSGTADENFDVGISDVENIPKLAYADDSLYFSGIFVIGEDWYWVAKVDPDTGALDESFVSPQLHSEEEGHGWAFYPNALAIYGDYLYLGGGVNIWDCDIESCGMPEFIRLDKDSGEIDTGCEIDLTGENLWDNPWPSSIVIDGTAGYVGGYFSIEGSDGFYSLFQFDTATCTINSDWTPNPTYIEDDYRYPGEIGGLALTEDHLWVGGWFFEIAGEQIYNLAYFDLEQPDTQPPVPSGFNPPSGSTITSLPFNLTFTTDENATCRISFTDEGYEDMADDFLCDGGGTQNQSCSLNDLVEGQTILYIACVDENGNSHQVGFTVPYSITLDEEEGEDEDDDGQLPRTGEKNVILLVAAASLTLTLTGRTTFRGRKRLVH
jgi:hypothetical protein